MSKRASNCNWTDEEMIEGLKSSENEAFDCFYKLYSPMIHQFIKVNSGTTDDAKDVFQDCLIDFHEKLKLQNLKLSCSIKTYFYSMCRNQWLNRLKRGSRTEQLTETHTETVETDDPIDRKETINERQKALMNLLNQLGNPCQSILVLFYYDRLSMTGIASRLGYTNADNAKNQKSRCMRKLKELVSGNHQLRDFLKGLL